MRVVSSAWPTRPSVSREDVGQPDHLNDGPRVRCLVAVLPAHRDRPDHQRTITGSRQPAQAQARGTRPRTVPVREVDFNPLPRCRRRGDRGHASCRHRIAKRALVRESRAWGQDADARPKQAPSWIHGRPQSAVLRSDILATAAGPLVSTCGGRASAYPLTRASRTSARSWPGSVAHGIQFVTPAESVAVINAAWTGASGKPRTGN